MIHTFGEAFVKVWCINVPIAFPLKGNILVKTVTLVGVTRCCITFPYFSCLHENFLLRPIRSWQYLVKDSFVAPGRRRHVTGLLSANDIGVISHMLQTHVTQKHSHSINILTQHLVPFSGNQNCSPNQDVFGSAMIRWQMWLQLFFFFYVFHLSFLQLYFV